MKCLIFMNADTFSQPSLIIFTKGADILGHDYIYNEWIYIFMVSSVIFFPLSFSTIHIVALPIKELVSLNTYLKNI